MEAIKTGPPVILVVDDELDIGLALGDLLGNEGYRVETVETGREALRRVSSARHPYSAVILDLGLPDLDGLTVLQRVHAKDLALPVIILTAHGDQREKIAALEHHAFAHMVKPYDRREVIELVQRAVKVKNLTVKAEQAERALTSSEARRQLEQLRTQTLLSESEQRLSLALKAGNMGIWDWDVVSDRVIWSEEVAGLFGIAQDAVPQTFGEFLPCIHPEDRAMSTEAVQATLNLDAPFELDHRILWPSGKSVGSVVKDRSSEMRKDARGVCSERFRISLSESSKTFSYGKAKPDSGRW